MSPGRYLSDLLPAFDAYLQVERNYSVRTRDIYRYELRRFMEFMIRSAGREVPLADISSQHIRDFLHHMQMDNNYRSATVSRIISTLKSFFRFCVEQRYLEISPADLIRLPKQPKKLPIYLVSEELKKLLDAPDRDTFIGIRDYAILVTLGFTGIRRQELISANVDDVNFSHSSLKVFGKGAKERLVPLNNWVLDALRAYMDQRPITETRALFININNRRGGLKERPEGDDRRLSPVTVHNIVKKYVRLACVGNSKISPHKLRHTFATLLHMNNVDILEIQKLLGHAAITSTQIYTHTHSDRLKKAVDTLDDI